MRRREPICKELNGSIPAWVLETQAGIQYKKSVQKFFRLILSCSPPTTKIPRKLFVFHTVSGRKMAAQGGAEDKILRVSMLFERGGNLARKARTVLPQKHLSFGNAADPSSVVLKVRFWAAQLRDGKVRSCAEIARKEGITSARVSQLWPLSRMTAKRMDDVLEASKDGRISLRQLLRIVRESETKRRVSQAEKAATG